VRPVRPPAGAPGQLCTLTDILHIDPTLLLFLEDREVVYLDTAVSQ